VAINNFPGHFILPLLAFLAVSGSVVSCEKSDPSDDGFDLSLRTEASIYSNGQTFVDIKSPGDWTLAIEPQVDWASVGRKSGSGSTNGIALSWKENSDSKSRSLTVVLHGPSASISKTFTQSGKGQDLGIYSDPVKGWMELPAVNDASLYFIHHPMKIGTASTRNYSYNWDTQNLVARWVAYPINKSLRSGSCGRSEQWGLDPRVPSKYQPVLYKAFKGFGERGHQIPSADRQQLAYNIETYYGTNMTPQNGNLNENVWAQLEQYVRDRGDMLDTLYVITGCTVSGSTRKAYDNDGKTVTVPTGYFKALLGYKKAKTIGITARTGGYTAIGFYFANESYSGSYHDKSCTLSELESITGMDFFMNLPSNVKKTVKTTKDDWWTK